VQAVQILKLIARPRNDEQFDIVKRIENRLVYETETIEKPHSCCSDEEDMGEECD
jgi:hypothetical protein